jgi:hypothetical protein
VNHLFKSELYRIRRESKPGTSFDKPGLFHIPFEERHKVKRQRYSIPGLPSLYLGGSLYVCWEELRRPKFESIHVARFEVAPGEKITVLDFMARPRHMVVGASLDPCLADGGEKEDDYCAWAVCWPLMAAAAIAPQHDGEPFIAEYIIPQLILQWITDKSHADVDGIAYTSVICKTHSDYPAAIADLVFPAKEMAASGYCPRLRRKFAMTPPIAWHLLERVNLPSAGPSASSTELEGLIPGVKTAYGDTALCPQPSCKRTP